MNKRPSEKFDEWAKGMGHKPREIRFTFFRISLEAISSFLKKLFRRKRNEKNNINDNDFPLGV